MFEYSVSPVTKRFFSMLGFARRAGKTVHGTEVICEKMRVKKQLVLVLISQDASQGTKEKLVHKCTFFDVPFKVVAASKEELGSICGKGELSCVGITDKMFSEQLVLECQ